MIGSKPTIQIRVAFNDPPFTAYASCTWTDITSFASDRDPISVRRGRVFELDRIEAGTLSFTLDNRDRRFEPGVMSPYNLIPGRKINLRAQWSGVWYDIFTGFVEEWQPEYPTFGDAVVRVRAADALAIFARMSFSASRPSEKTNTRIREILISIGWPTSDTWLAYGKTTLAATTYTDTNVLSAMQDAATHELGVLTMQRDGFVDMHDRHYRIVNASSVATWGDNTGEYPYKELSFSFDNQNIINHTEMTAGVGVTQVGDDAISQSAYGVISKSETLPMLLSQNEASDRGQWLIYRYKDPSLRIDSMVLQPEMNPVMWSYVLSSIIDSRVTVRRRPLKISGGWALGVAGGDRLGTDTMLSSAAIEINCRIEAIKHDIWLDDWLVTWQLSPANTDLFWKLEDATLGVLDVTTIPAY